MFLHKEVQNVPCKFIIQEPIEPVNRVLKIFFTVVCMSTFGDRLRELRQKSGVKQTAIAEMLGVLPRTIRFYESGKREPNIESIKKLAEFFGVSTDYLLGHSDNPQR